MIKISKNHFSLYCFITLFLFFVESADANILSSDKERFSCSESVSFYRCNYGKWHEISNKTYQLTGEVSDGVIGAFGKETVIEAEKITINSISSANGHASKSPWTTGVKVSEGGVTPIYSTLTGLSIGEDVDDDGAFEM
ncbi:hypothetical protein MEI_01057 [Bartonella vinsonii subsp. arupensis Pm136co]|uniref:Uncharacterized protein n=1 Tax=Bartonella vinsonii subsp. arupensis Pm136co TaxID=1094561 RepID=A0ABP2QUW9_BARVI|nr:hypothetical protein MEI_01057 [Bartonella vinsonii subsp. arupensis Pm136co]